MKEYNERAEWVHSILIKIIENMNDEELQLQELKEINNEIAEDRTKKIQRPAEYIDRRKFRKMQVEVTKNNHSVQRSNWYQALPDHLEMLNTFGADVGKGPFPLPSQFKPLDD
jgi:hypothetical protein